jgi:hypothetical protein
VLLLLQVLHGSQGQPNVPCITYEQWLKPEA